MSFAYLHSLRILHEKVNPEITNLKILNIIWQNIILDDKIMTEFLKLIDQELINLAGIKWFLDRGNKFPCLIFKLIEYCDEEQLQLIINFIRDEWMNVIHIKDYKIARNIIIQKLPTAFDEYGYDGCKTILMEYKGIQKVLTFGELSYVSKKCETILEQFDDITYHITKEKIKIDKYNQCIVEECMSSNLNFQKDELKISTGYYSINYLLDHFA